MTVINGSQGATALVGMAGFVVGAQELIDGEWWLYVETTADLVGCRGCGTRAVGHGRARTPVRDLPIAGRPTVLVFARRRWRCPDVDCEVNTWSERVDAIAPRASLTRRVRERMALMVNAQDNSIAAVAREFGVGWHTANAAVAEFTDPVIDDESRLEGVVALGVDEKRFTNAGPRKRTTFTTQVVDLDRRVLLDVIEGRSKTVLADWLDARPAEWLAGIRVATLDPSAGYRRALLEHLPNATLVVDCFHGVKLGNDAVDDVRRRVQQKTTGHRGHKGDPLWRTPRSFQDLTRHDMISDKIRPVRPKATGRSRSGVGGHGPAQSTPPPGHPPGPSPRRRHRSQQQPSNPMLALRTHPQPTPTAPQRTPRLLDRRPPLRRPNRRTPRPRSLNLQLQRRSQSRQPTPTQTPNHPQLVGKPRRKRPASTESSQPHTLSLIHI